VVAGRSVIPGRNTHFAHTAGGMMIGRSLSNKLLDGKTMHFYEWGQGSPSPYGLPGLYGTWLQVLRVGGVC